MAGGQGGRRKPPASKPKAPVPPGGPGNQAESERVSAASRRKEAAEARRRKEALRRNLIIGAVAVVLVALLGVCVTQRSKDSEAQDELVARLTSGDCRYDTESDSGSEHVENPPAYKVNPPTGGNHTPQAAAAGVYREGQVPPDGPLVHAQEHGFVVIWYRPGDATITSQAEALGDEFSDETLVVPRASMDVPVAATAWHRRLLCTSLEEDTLKEFTRAYRDKGPEKGFIP
jgi:hypothetical protein